jgi:hypothetical protein
VFGDAGPRIVSPFRFASAPELQAEGRLDYDPATGGVRPDLRVTGSTPGVVEFLQFPVSSVRFTAEVKDDEITVVPEVGFAGGRGTGQVVLKGRVGQQALSFNYAMKGMKLGLAAEALEEYSSRRTGRPRTGRSAYLTRAADVDVEIAATASGPANDPYGLKGQGTAQLGGANLGEVPLFGLLSEIIPVLSLRFTRMQSPFEIDGQLLRLPDVKLAGSSSGIEARGVYDLRTRALDFNARVYPFSESSNVIQDVFDFLTRPISNLFEVHLGGTLGSPQWSLAATRPIPRHAPAEATTVPAAPAPAGP